MPYKNIEDKKIYQRSVRYKEIHKKYAASPKGRAAQKRFRDSPARKIYAKEYYKTWYLKCINSWVELNIIPKETNCERCNKLIIFNSGDTINSIHFDHRHGGDEPIKKPMTWLWRNIASKKCIDKWKSCDFGMLCINCNRMLPTNNRIKELELSLKYAKENL